MREVGVQIGNPGYKVSDPGRPNWKSRSRACAAKTANKEASWQM
jgi:hypothetical protein